MSDDPSAYNEADKVLETAKRMFGEHTAMVTGRSWNWDDASEQIRTIWIIKAARLA